LGEGILHRKEERSPFFSGSKAVQGALIAIIVFAIPTTNRVFSRDDVKIIP